MNAPLQSEDVAGIDDLTDADLDALGVPSIDQNDMRPRRTAWKARALRAEAAVADEQRAAAFWRLAALFLALTTLAALAALLVAVRA